MGLQLTNEQIVKGIKLETKSKEEAQKLYQRWNQGPYNFLLQRTLNNYNKTKTAQRRNQASKVIQKDLPPISDETLLWLYQQAIQKHIKECQTKYQNSGYQDTPSERNFQKTIEIDGDSHVYKYEKDLQKEKHLESLGIATLPVPNDKARNEKHIKEILDSWFKNRSGALDLQIKRNKRKIWAKTVACQMTLVEVEELVKAKFHVDLFLIEEAAHLKKLNNCPRSIKREINF